MQCANLQANQYSTDGPYYSTVRLTTDGTDYEDMPYETEYEAEYTVEWNNIDRDIRCTEEMRSGFETTSSYYGNRDCDQIGRSLYIDGEDRTVMISAKKYLLKNIHYFDISPLKADNFREIHICRVGSFPSQEGGMKKINLCYKPQNWYSDSPFITTIQTKRFGNCDIRFEVEHKVASITLYVGLSILAVILAIGFLTKGAMMGYRKIVSMKTGSLNNDYQHI